MRRDWDWVSRLRPEGIRTPAALVVEIVVKAVSVIMQRYSNCCKLLCILDFMVGSSRLVGVHWCDYGVENRGDSHRYDAREMELIGLKLPLFVILWILLV